MNQLGGQLNEGFKDKSPRMQERVGDHEVSRVYYLFTEKEYVKIDNSRSPLFSPYPAHLEFYGQETVQELGWSAVRLHLGDAVCIPLLAGDTFRLGLEKIGTGRNLTPRHPVYSRHGMFAVQCLTAEI